MTPEDFATLYSKLKTEIARAVVGQDELVDGIIVATLARGHALIEGAPGLGKTLAVRAFAAASGCAFKRLQFTPDLMPSDITGSSIFDRQTSELRFVPGPIFAELILADEINRAPAKTQSALLEAMQDHTVTEGGTTRALPSPFTVVATQNPIESQGTYPLPEAQLDRFLLKLSVEDPPRETEEAIVKRQVEGFDPDKLELSTVSSPAEIVAMQAYAQRVRVDDAIVSYIVDLVRRTREDRSIDVGASPRASLALMRVAQVRAASEERDFVVPDDVKPMALPVLRHRVLLHPDAQLQDISADERVTAIVKATPVPRAKA